MPVSVASIVETIAPVATGAVRAIGSPGPGRDFASLVRAMLSARAGGNGAGSLDAGLAAPMLTLAAATSDGSDAELAAALAGSLLAAQVAAPALAASAIPTEADAPGTGIGAPVAVPQGELANAAIGASQALPPTEAGGSGATTPPAASPPDQKPVVAPQPLPPGNWEGYTDAADLPQHLRNIPDGATTLALAEAALQAAMGGSDASEAPAGHGKRPIEPPPGLEAVAGTNSVVRFAGNAEAGTAAGGRGDRQGDHPPAGAIQQIAAGVATATVNSADAAAPAANTAPAAGAGPSVDLPPAVQRVEQAVIDAAERGGGEARIRLDPPELGSMHIRVRIDGDQVHLHVEADRLAAASLLRDHTGSLSALLGDRGLNLADVYVGLGGGGSPGDTSGDAPWQRGRPRPNDGEFAAILGIDTPAAASTHNRLRSAYNPDGAHSYRV